MTSTRPHDVREHPWSTGLCGCFDDIKSCCITFWCPCITFGQTSEILDKGQTTCVMNCAIYTLIYLLASLRHELRNLHADLLADFVRMPLFMLLPNQTETRIRVEGGSVQRLLSPLLLHVLRALSRVSRAQEPRIQHGEGMGRKRQATERSGNGSKGGRRHEALEFCAV